VTTKLTEMTERELASWYWSRDMDTHAETLAALRDGVVAEVRAECEAALAEARREGAYAALTKLCDDLHGNDRGTCELVNSGVCSVTRFRDTHYAPPVPASVTLGEWIVTYEPHTVTANWRADGKEQGYKATRFEHTIPALLHAIRYTPTVDEYAALRALEARQ
jgi:hypothetical protein